jgi:hypothetical protein
VLGAFLLTTAFAAPIAIAIPESAPPAHVMWTTRPLLVLWSPLLGPPVVLASESVGIPDDVYTGVWIHYEVVVVKFGGAELRTSSVRNSHFSGKRWSRSQGRSVRAGVSGPRVPNLRFALYRRYHFSCCESFRRRRATAGGDRGLLEDAATSWPA